MLRIENACIEYDGRELFRGLSLHVAKGEMVCLTGESGRGKTSLLRAVMGFVPLREGTICVEGTLLTPQTRSEIRRRIAWLPQETAFPAEWVRELVQQPFRLKANAAVPFSETDMFGSFKALGLERELYDRRVSEISGGQKQRILLAVAALLGKPLLLADEPTSALDGESALQVLDFLRRLSGEGRTIVAVSHDRTFAAGCHRTVPL